jgi:hypothetical protein
VRVRWSANDASPLHQRELAVTVALLEDKDGAAVLWSMTGGYQISDQSSKAEAEAAAVEIRRLDAVADKFREVLARKQGLAPARRASGLAKFGGGVMSTDGAANALKFSDEFAAIVKPAAASASDRADAVCDDDDDPMGSDEPGASTCS